MARKNLLASITGPTVDRSLHEARSDYATRGASRSMMLSIEELAESAKRLTDGETIVALDPNLLDASFVADRIEDDEEEFALFREGIEKDGQLQPILVRPHPEREGRYMIVFGHRRARAAREIGISVRAVVKNVEEIAHIIAQGQENTRRADLSFIEKSLFAARLQAMGQSKDTIKSALSVDDTLLSRMLSVTEIVPASIIEAIGAAKTIGRDRWEELKKLLLRPGAAGQAADLLGSDAFKELDTPARFNQLLTQLQRARKPVRPAPTPDAVGNWSPSDKRVAASYRNTGKAFSLSLKSKDAGEFGHYLSSNLEALYQAFREAKQRNQAGD
ncbi:plasmid partitioning protein RepB [Labrys neptuniae]